MPKGDAGKLSVCVGKRSGKAVTGGEAALIADRLHSECRRTDRCVTLKKKYQATDASCGGVAFMRRVACETAPAVRGTGTSYGLKPRASARPSLNPLNELRTFALAEDTRYGHGTSAHRTQVKPSNADEEPRMPEPSADRNIQTASIAHAGDSTPFGDRRTYSQSRQNQVRAIRIMLSGSSDDMQRIMREGRLDEWCADNMKYLAATFGKENIVSADLHLDETSPHVHATLVPIIMTEREA